MTDSTPGWQPDPTGKHDHRYWDGSRWTDNVSDAGVAGVDPYEAAAGDAAGDATVADAPAMSAGGAEPPPPMDPTATQPVAPAAPAPPPPYNPAAAPAPGGDGSKRSLLIGGGILAVIALAVIAFFALGSDDDDDSGVRAQLASKLADEADGAITDDQAECVADLLVDEAGEDAFEDVDFDADEAPEVVLNAFDAVGEDEILERCDIDPEAFGGSDGATDSTDDGGDDSTDDGGDDGGDDELESLRDDCADGDFEACDDLYFSADIGSDLEEFGSTCGGIADPQDGFCTETNGGQDEEGSDDGGLTDSGALPDDFIDILVESYEDMGLDRDQAECLAGKMLDAIESGDLSEEEVFSDFMTYFSDCDIDPSEISGN